MGLSPKHCVSMRFTYVIHTVNFQISPYQNTQLQLQQQLTQQNTFVATIRIVYVYWY